MKDKSVVVSRPTKREGKSEKDGENGDEKEGKGKSKKKGEKMGGAVHSTRLPFSSRGDRPLA